MRIARSKVLPLPPDVVSDRLLAGALALQPGLKTPVRPPHKMHVHVVDRESTGDIRYTIAPDGDGTRVDVAVDFKFHGAVGLAVEAASHFIKLDGLEDFDRMIFTPFETGDWSEATLSPSQPARDTRDPQTVASAVGFAMEDDGQHMVLRPSARVVVTRALLPVAVVVALLGIGLTLRQPWSVLAVLALVFLVPSAVIQLRPGVNVLRLGPDGLEWHRRLRTERCPWPALGPFFAYARDSTSAGQSVRQVSFSTPKHVDATTRYDPSAFFDKHHSITVKSGMYAIYSADIEPLADVLNLWRKHYAPQPEATEDPATVTVQLD